MTHNLPQINNQDGFLMLIALLIMATLAVAGLMVTNDAVMESHVGRNYAIHKQCESASEAAGKEFIQAIDSIFDDPTNITAADAVADLDTEAWRPYDDYNTTFDFDPANWSAYRKKISNLMGTVSYLNAGDPAGAVAVLVDQTSSAMTFGLSSTKVPEYYTYVIYCRAVHAGAGNSETILMIGYRQEKT